MFLKLLDILTLFVVGFKEYSSYSKKEDLRTHSCYIWFKQRKCEMGVLTARRVHTKFKGNLTLLQIPSNTHCNAVNDT